MVDRITLASNDGRLNWIENIDDPMSSEAPVIEDRARRLAAEVLPGLEELLEDTAELEGKYQGEWLPDYLFATCREYLKRREWRELPRAAEYRATLAQVLDSARNLHSALAQTPEPVAQWLSYYFIEHDVPLQLRPDLWDPVGVVVEGKSLTEILAHLIVAADALPPPNSKRGPRPRDDLIYLAAAAGDLWSHLSGKRIPKNIDVHDGTLLAPGARFVERVIRLFDAEAGFSSIVKALKDLKVQPGK